MLMVNFVLHALEVIFFVGLTGSAIVVIMSSIEDGKELFEKEKEPHQHA